jgi:asparagine synthase (glutamine-hydrolysing)
MCGICGEYNFQTNRPANLERIRSMTDSIAHRGPDDDGVYCRGPVALGFRRLSIIDLEGGHQPMSDPERGVFLIFNGEIYNFAVLKAELEARGHRFTSRSDTEVILRGYIEWGIDVLSKLNGMFGVAIWDERQRRLMLARDRLGVKPLYYRVNDDGVVFGSEIRAIAAHESSDLEIDATALNLFLHYRYTPAPLTVYKGIQKLAAGTRLIVEDGVARVQRWWQFHPEPFDPMPTVGEAEENLTELYRKAVERQLISDVPVGVFLSGGLDSGLLLGLMHEHRSDWKSYSVGFGGQFRNDELLHAAQTARHFQAQNFAVELTRDDFERNLVRAVRAVEEPVAADSIAPMYALCQRARQDVKVALMGQGPDELFGGYRRHLFARYSAGAKWFSGSRLLSWAAAGLLDDASALRLLTSLEAPAGLQRYQSIFRQLPGNTVDELFQSGLLRPNAADTILDCWNDLTSLMPQTDVLAGLQFLELRSSLPDELLVYADKLSMAHGLEVRVPFLDHEIVEYVERLSSSFKVRNGSRKWLHRRLCRHFLPKQVTVRPKIGFETPSADWLRSGTGGSSADYLRDPQSRIYEFLNHERVSALLCEHRNGSSQSSNLLFSLVALEVWLREVRDQVAVPSPGKLLASVQ